jgi:hypothetical protein
MRQGSSKKLLVKSSLKQEEKEAEVLDNAVKTNHLANAHIQRVTPKLDAVENVL